MDGYSTIGFLVDFLYLVFVGFSCSADFYVYVSVGFSCSAGFSSSSFSWIIG